MLFTYQAITANCGNNDFGPQATESLCKHIMDSNCDFYILNLQEAQYSFIESTLKTLLGETYEVIKCASMDTLTNINSMGAYITQNGVGIANILIYNKSKYTHQIDSEIAKRRYTSLSDPDSELKGYNKGGVCSIVTLKSQESPDDESIKIQMISGHLDANSPAKRAKDWKNIQEIASVTLTETSTWEDLISSLPDLRISGIDCNTRDLITTPDTPIMTLDDVEVKGFNQFPLGNLRFSSTETYIPKETHKEEKKVRYGTQGYTLSGSLDVNEILNYQPPEFKNLDIESSVSLDPDENHPRDHKIIITPTLTIQKLNDFEHVKLHLSILLEKASPLLADAMTKLSDTPESRQKLLEIFRLLIAKDGLLFKIQSLYHHKLDFINNMKELKRSPLVIDGYKHQFFSSLSWLYDLLIENISDIVPILNDDIKKTTELLKNPPVIRSLEELKKDCCDILKQYEIQKSASLISYFLTSSKQAIKKAAIQDLIKTINDSNSTEEISVAFLNIKRNTELFVKSGEDVTIGVLATLIQEAEKLIKDSDVLSFEDENRFPNLKKWVINKLDSYSTLPKENPARNAASIEKKINACHELIAIVADSNDIEEIFNGISRYRALHIRDLFKGSSGKFSQIVDDCLEMTLRYMELEQSSQLKK